MKLLSFLEYQSEKNIRCLTERLSDIGVPKNHFPWDLVCGYQIAGILNRIKDEEFVWQVSKNQKLVSYATMILSEPSMHPNFEFFMTEFLKEYL